MARPTNLLEFRLYRFLVERYSSPRESAERDSGSNIKELAARIFKDSPIELQSTSAEECAAELISACRYQGRVEEFRVLIVREQYQLIKEGLQRDDDNQLLTLNPVLADEVHSIAITVAPDKDSITAAIGRASTITIVDSGASSSHAECYRRVMDCIEECSAYALVLGREPFPAIAGVENRTIADLAFDCALFQGIPTYVFFPKDLQLEPVSVWRDRIDGLRIHGQRNLKPYDYTDELDLYSQIQNIFGIKRRRDLPKPNGPLRPPGKPRVFISYSHEDFVLCRKLLAHLKPVKADFWSDNEITAGKRFDQEIEKEIRNARIILFLVSSDWNSSEYIFEKELKLAHGLSRSKGVRIVPVILRPFLWHETLLSGLDALPQLDKVVTPVTEWDSEDAALLNVAEGVKKVIEELKSSR